MILPLIQFEVRYHRRQPLLYAGIVVFFIFGLLLGSQNPAGGGRVFLNSPHAISYRFGMLSLFAIFLLTAFSAQVMTRDARALMADIVYATPVRKLVFLTSRFIGILIAALLAFAGAIAGMLIALYLPWNQDALIGPFSLWHYVWPLVVQVLPSMLLVGAVLFATASLSGSMLVTWVGGLVFYCLYFLSAMLLDSPMIAGATPATQLGMALAAVSDPFALSAFFEQTRYWTAMEKNTQMLELQGYLLANRALWSVMGALVLAGLYRAFRFRPKLIRSQARDEVPAIPAAMHYRPAEQRTEAADHALRGLLAVVRLEFAALYRSLPFLAAMLLWAIVAGAEIVTGIANGNGGSPSLPATSLILPLFREPLRPICLLIIMFFTAEHVHRERSARFDEMLDVTPIPTWLQPAAKVAALASIPVVMILLACGVGVGYQLLNGYADLRPALYAAVLYVDGVPLVLLTLAAVAIQAITNNRYVGMLVLLLLFFGVHAGLFTGIEHVMLRVAAAPPVLFSEMNGLGHFLWPVHIMMIYWGAFMILLCMLALCLWRRGTAPMQLRTVLRGWGSAKTAVFRGGSAVFVLTGLVVFVNTNILNRYETRDARNAWRADYEAQYASYAALPQPSVVALNAEVSLFPDKRRAEIRGRYTLENRGMAPIDSILIATARDVSLVAVDIEGAEHVGTDAKFGTFWYTLDPPLAYGDNRELRFDIDIRNQGFRSGMADNAVVSNGSFVMFTRFFPRLGYRRGWALQDPMERKKRGLPELRDTTDEHTRAYTADHVSPLQLEVVVSTSSDQTALAPGELQRNWTAGNRSYYHYKTSAPVTPFFGVGSARYAVARSDHEDIAIELYHHPEHTENVERMQAAAAQTLDYASENFGPYPFPGLRIFEIPSYWSFFSGVGMPGMIGFLENRGFLADAESPGAMDLVTRRVAHEVAHQWWGHRLQVADAPGGNVLVESLAKYTELMVLQQRYGRPALRRFQAYETDRYLRGRAAERERELPLTKTENQPYLAYSKGALVMYALQDLLGEAAFNRVLRDLLEMPAPNGGVRIDALVAGLRAAVDPDWQSLVDDWLGRIFLYDLRVDAARAEQLPDGRYRVVLTVDARRSEVGDDGMEQSEPIDEELEIGIFSVHPDRIEHPSQTLYLGKHRIGAEETEIEVVVEHLPAYAAVDPFMLRIDRNLFDNVKRVGEDLR